MFDSLTNALQNKRQKPSSTVSAQSNTNNNNNLQVADLRIYVLRIMYSQSNARIRSVRVISQK